MFIWTRFLFRWWCAYGMNGSERNGKLQEGRGHFKADRAAYMAPMACPALCLCVILTLLFSPYFASNAIGRREEPRNWLEWESVWLNCFIFWCMQLVHIWAVCTPSWVKSTAVAMFTNDSNTNKDSYSNNCWANGVKRWTSGGVIKSQMIKRKFFHRTLFIKWRTGNGRWADEQGKHGFSMASEIQLCLACT